MDYNSNWNPSNISAHARKVSTRHTNEYSPAKTGDYPRIFPNFQNCACYKKDLKDTTASIWGRNMFRYLSLDIILELRSRITVRFSEQIMSADKYRSIFSCQMEAIVYLLSCYSNI